MPNPEAQAYRRLYQLAHALHEVQGSPRAVLTTVLEHTKQALNAEHGCIMAYDADGAAGETVLSDAHARRDDVALWQRLSQLVQDGRQTVTIGDLTDQPWPRRDKTLATPTSGSAVAVALEHETRLLGAVMLYQSAPMFFDTESIRLIEMMAATGAAALANAQQRAMLADSQALYRRLYKDASLPTIITDLNGDIIDANPKAANTLGYDRQALAGRPLAAIMQIGRDPLSAENLQSAAWNQDFELNAIARTAKGEPLALRLFARRIHLDSADYLVWTGLDISPQVELDTHRRDLASMIYHDLRGPLNNINLSLSRVDTLLTERSPAVADLLAMALRSTRQLTRMLNTLLDVEQLERGRAELALQPAAVSDLIAQAIETTNMVNEDAGHEIRLGVQPNLPPVSVDIDMMVRVIVNLLENAIKYTPSGGQILVEAGNYDHRVRIALSDNGPGIPTDLHEQIFDKYVRIRKAPNRMGHGLGLAFCKLAVEAHGGRIWVEDNLPQGARFVFTLPLVER